MKSKKAFALRLTPLASAIGLLFISVPALADDAGSQVNLGAVVVNAQTPDTLPATVTAPSQNTLDARKPMSNVGQAYIDNNIAPTADFTQIVNLTPGAFAFNSGNGIGMADTKIVVRGMQDGSNYSPSLNFDGIPFTDTNNVSHHSWDFFPTQFLGGASVDRSPGLASDIGQGLFAGTVVLHSKQLSADPMTSLEASVGSYGTRLFDIQHQTGAVGDNGDNELWFDVHNEKSNGAFMDNGVERTGAALKFQHTVSPDTRVTFYADYLDLISHTPNTQGVTRSQYAVGDYNGLLSNNPAVGSYYGYNYYDVPTSFSYLGLDTKWADWTVNDKAYLYTYQNHQYYDNYSVNANGSLSQTVSSSSAVDKFNSYATFGNILRLSKDSATGRIDTGLWLEDAETRRYQIKSNPVTLVDVKAPNFYEKFLTTTIQPYVDYAWHATPDLDITPGIKYAAYRQAFMHDQDLGKGVGALGGTISGTTITGGQSSVDNSLSYSDWLPSIDAHYKLQPNWSVYGMYAWGDEIAPTSVSDVANANVTNPPNSQKSKSLEFGTVWAGQQLSASADVYAIKIDNAWNGVTDNNPLSATYGQTIYVPTPQAFNRGVEVEANYALGSGFSVYGNATMGSFTYANGLWVSYAPNNTEVVALNYDKGPWNGNLQVQRVGRFYADNGAINNAFTIDPIVVTNLFVNYTLDAKFGYVKQTKIQFGINNLFDRRDITDVKGVTGSSSANPAAGDLLSVLSGRQLTLGATLQF